jgi:hypothetical protein
MLHSLGDPNDAYTAAKIGATVDGTEYRVSIVG